MPLTLEESQALLKTVDPAWQLVMNDDDNDNGKDGSYLVAGDEEDEGNDQKGDASDDDGTADENVVRTSDDDSSDTVASTTIVPFAIRRDFCHNNYHQAALFVSHVVAAVAEMNNHYPHQCKIQRRLVRAKGGQRGGGPQWQVVTSVTCRTFVLRGLSHHDFFLATMIDVELDRPNVRILLA
jgi:pterin-4a-carbinolamine dehydratase